MSDDEIQGLTTIKNTTTDKVIDRVPIYSELPKFNKNGYMFVVMNQKVYVWVNGHWTYGNNYLVDPPIYDWVDGYWTLSKKYKVKEDKPVSITTKNESIQLVANWKITFQLADQRTGEAYVEEKYRDRLIEGLVTNNVAILGVTSV